MSGLIECIPNFSEGRDATVVGQIVAAIGGVEGVRVLDYSLNPDHHRSVVTVVGPAEAVVEAAFRGVRAQEVDRGLAFGIADARLGRVGTYDLDAPPMVMSAHLRLQVVSHH